MPFSIVRMMSAFFIGKKVVVLNVFEAVKQSVATREVAELYGIKVRRNGLACCPFHDDRTPSMKLDKRFHCFGCQADGDAVDFVSKLYGLSLKDAAIKIADDFGLAYNLNQHRIVKPKIREPTEREKIQQEKHHCINVLTDYLHLLLQWERDYAPKSFEEEIHPLFVEAMHKRDYLDYLLDLVYQTPEDEIFALLAELRTEVMKIEARVTEYRRNREYKKQSCHDTAR